MLGLTASIIRSEVRIWAVASCGVDIRYSIDELLGFYHEAPIAPSLEGKSDVRAFVCNQSQILEKPFEPICLSFHNTEEVLPLLCVKR